MAYRVEANVWSDRLMSATEAAYMAGIIDGEGSIYFVALAAKGRRSHHFQLEMRIGNTNLDLLHHVVKVTGNGWINLSNRTMGPNHKQGYVWELSPRQIRHVLPQVTPYLVAKKRQAEIALRFIAIQRAGARSDGMGRTLEADIPEVLDLYAEMRALNQRGLVGPAPLQFVIAAPGTAVADERATRRFCQQGGCVARAYLAFPYCYQHWLERRERVVKPCERCGQSMDCVMPSKRFCSPKCQWQSAYERRKQNDAA